MITIPGKIPIIIRPVFWLLAAFIGFMQSRTLTGTLMWIFVIVISVLVHELGHAITSVFFGQKPTIELVALGGVTSYKGRTLRLWQQFLIALNGPIFGFLLFLVSTFLLYLNIFHHPLIVHVLRIFQFINLFWTIVNLLPVLPLDGGQLLRIAMEGAFGLKGFKLTLLIGSLVSLAISLLFFVLQQFLVGAIFFLFAFQSFMGWRKTKYLSSPDRKETNVLKLQKGEALLKRGNKQEAKRIFDEIRERTKKGMIFASATYYLAMLDFEEGKNHEAYELLLSVKDLLEEEALCLLQKLAYHEQDFSLVVALSSVCYERFPNQETALLNARAYAHLNQPKPAGGWLVCALDFDDVDKEKILHEEVFDSVRKDPEFQSFFHLTKE